MAQPCPSCRRPNADHRETCLYCGAGMPAPSGPRPPKGERALPANFDDLVRRAMSGGGVGALKQALEASKAAPVVGVPGAEVPAAKPGAEAPVGVGAAGSPDEAVPPRTLAVAPRAAAPAPTPEAAPAAGGPPPLPAPDPLEALAAAAQAALAARNDAPRLRAALADAAKALAAAEATVADAPLAPGAPPEPAPPEPEPDADDGPPVRLPLARHPFGLVLGAPPAGFETGQLAALLEVDLATARAALLAGGARIVLRGAARAELERRVAALRGAGLDACVVDRDELLAPGAARALVAASRADVWRVAEVPRWGEDRPDPSQLMRGEPWVPAAPRLLVPGEVDEKRLREAPASSRWQRAHYAPLTGAGGEVRVAVLDVHTDDAIFRVVEGAVDLRELAGVEAGSARKALKALQDALAARWPEVRVEARRTCAAAPRAGMPHRADGWAAFEEHSRACRRLWLGAAPVRTPGEPAPS